MANKVVLDSCVFNKLFLQEPDSQQAVDLISELTLQDYRVIVPGCSYSPPPLKKGD